MKEEEEEEGHMLSLEKQITSDFLYTFIRYQEDGSYFVNIHYKRLQPKSSGPKVKIYRTYLKYLIIAYLLFIKHIKLWRTPPKSEHVDNDNTPADLCAQVRFLL